MLVVALGVQLLLGAGLLYAAATDFRFLGLDRHAAPAPAARAAVDRFDGDRAFRLARLQVALGPRPAGSPAARTAAELLRRRLPAGRFMELGPRFPGLRNVVGEIGGRGRPVLLVAHYDTTPVPGYLGANNSAAAVGAVVELSRRLREQRGKRGVQFLLTDGEEAPTYPVQGDFATQGLRGSRVAARRLDPAYVIVLDFVGNRGLRLPREPFSDARLWARLRAAAGRVGHADLFPDAEQGAVQDDHLPFRARGIPAVDLIDFSYRCWQKRCDTLDQLDPRKLDGVGESVLELVRTLRG